MSIKLGATDVSAVYLGSQAVKTIYLGDTAVWGWVDKTETISGTTGQYGILDEPTSTTMYNYNILVPIGTARNVTITVKRGAKATVSYNASTGKASCMIYATAANFLVSATLSYESYVV